MVETRPERKVIVRRMDCSARSAFTMSKIHTGSFRER